MTVQLIISDQVYKMYRLLLEILFLVWNVKQSGCSTWRVVLSGSTIPGQGYVQMFPPEDVPAWPVEVMVTNSGMTWSDFKKNVRVACITAGYNGTLSTPSLLSFYEKRTGPWLRNIQIRREGCRGNETTVLTCMHNLYYSDNNSYDLKVNCLPPDPSHDHGVFYDLWTDLSLSSQVSIWKLASLFQNEPKSSHILPTFDVKFRVRTQLWVKLSAYLTVNRTGMYSIGATCKDGCEVWWKRVEEQGLDDDGTSASMIIKLKSTLIPNEYERSPKQSKSIGLGCHLYHLEVYTRLLYQIYVEKFTNLAMRYHGDDKWTAPIPTKFLYWNRPGYRKLHFNLKNNISSQIDLGSQLLIEALYKFCCVGLSCPSCPLTLYLHVLGQKILVNSSLQMNCVEYHFKDAIDVIQQPRNYPIEISYYFDDVAGWIKKRTIVKTVEVSESMIYQCAVDSRHESCFAEWKVYTADKNVSTDTSLNVEEDCSKHCFCQGVKFLHSPVLPWKAIFNRISLCVSFLYRLSSNDFSRLDAYVSLKSRETHIWSARGFQGEAWNRGSIPVRFNEDFKIIFKLSSNINGTSCGIRHFQLSTSACELQPKLAKPGYRCPDSQYQCKNGECVDKKFRCNGKKDSCIDGSDETGCKCLTDQFSCFDGSCVDVSDLCNGKSNCKDSEDELRCGTQVCYQCIDGKCPTSLLTCHDTTYNISECWNFNENICRNKNEKCKAIKGICGFENGPCGMKNENGWTYYEPSKKSLYKSYDHSYLERGNKKVLHE